MTAKPSIAPVDLVGQTRRWSPFAGDDWLRLTSWTQYP